MEELKNQLNTQVLDVLKRPEHFKKYGVTIPNGMLLYGPPGCGKSFVSEKFCEEAGFNFFLINHRGWHSLIKFKSILLIISV